MGYEHTIDDEQDHSDAPAHFQYVRAFNIITQVGKGGMKAGRDEDRDDAHDQERGVELSCSD